ncbi:MAG TPA: zinc-binding dehydrogenase [Candidatus Binataceae bacterium]|nr:zinc-binding dehydrogenase [Candidatus Binataceae bacterium]
MKAIFLTPGPDGGIYEYREVPTPTPKAGEVLVKVRATGTNRGELIARPLFRSSNPALRPTPAGIEFAGEIAALGDAVGGWRAGDRVMGRAAGSYAEFVLVSPAQLMRVPDFLSWAEAASIPNVFVTAHDAIVTSARLAAGESAMITAGSSGIGTAAIQLARYFGANPVIATTRSAAKSAALSALGAHHVIDVSNSGWVDEALAPKRGVDVIIDNVGGPMLADNLRALAIKGRLISVGRNAGNNGECNMDQLAFKRASIIGVTFRTRTPEEALACAQRFAADCLDAVDSGALKPVLDRTFPFERLADAHAYMLSDAQVGKIVLTLG